MSAQELQQLLAEMADEVKPAQLHQRAIAQARRAGVRNAVAAGAAATAVLVAGISGTAALTGGDAEPDTGQPGADTATTEASDPQMILSVTNTKLPVGEVAEDVMDRDADQGYGNAVVGCVDVADGADGYVADEKVTERDMPEGGWTKPLIRCLDVAAREGFQNTAVEIEAWRGGQRSMILVAVWDGRAYELTFTAPKDAYRERVQYWREAVRAFTLR